MGCDIHGMLEVGDYSWDHMRKENKRFGWYNLGEFEPCGRNYQVFGVIGDVRNYAGVPFIAKQRLGDLPEDSFDIVSAPFEAWLKAWGGDAHSTSYVTLAEMKAYNTGVTYQCNRLITSRGDDGKITSTCGGTSGEHMGEVGEVQIFEEFDGGTERWHHIIDSMEKRKAMIEAEWDGYELADDEVRWVFFFDN